MSFVFNMGDMGFFRGPARDFLVCFDGQDVFFDLFRAEHNLFTGFDVAEASESGCDIVGHGGLECVVPHKGDDGIDVAFIDTEQFREIFDVAVILVKGVHEFGFFLVDDLGPLSLEFVSVDPSLHVFGLDDKDAIPGHDNMVDLGCPVMSGNGHILEDMVFLGYSLESRVNQPYTLMMNSPIFPLKTGFLQRTTRMPMRNNQKYVDVMPYLLVIVWNP